MKDIKDYIHLYIGCQVMDLYNNKIGKLIGVSEKEVLVMHNTSWGLTPQEVKPILRRLSSMTEEEAREIWDSCMEKTGYKFNHIDRLLASVNRIEVIAPVIPKLLAMGFDLFGLIDSNLAIDSSTITENKQ